MNRQYVPNFEILLKKQIRDGSNGIQSTDYISHGNCYVSYVGNFLVVEVVSNPSEDTYENRFTVYNLDEIKNFRYSGKLQNFAR